MERSNEVKKAEQKIVAVLARMLVLSPESIDAKSRYSDLLHTDPDALRAFGGQVEESLGVVLGDSILGAHPTIAELAVYCAEHRAAPRGGRLYVVVCQMPGGNVCERIYRARGHEKAAQQAIDDGAERILSVEREDAEDERPSGPGTVTKVLVPLLVGLLIGLFVFVFFWWRRGFPRFW